jgi:hypothetical protein
MMLYAGAFEVVGINRFISTLRIEMKSGGEPSGDAKLLSPPCPDALFADAEAALDSAITFARALIDGEIPGLTMDDLKAS